MKKLIISMMLLLMMGVVSSCRHELDSEAEGNHRNHLTQEKPGIKTLTMSFGGDYITESEEPLQRADEKEGETYTAINVYYIEQNKEDSQKEKYAYGLFKGRDPISIDIFTGYEYSFEATILKEREDVVKLLSGGYTDPFRLHDGNSEGFDNAWSFVSRNINKFHYTYLSGAEDSKNFFCQLTSGTAYVNSGGDLLDGNGNSITSDRWIRYPRVKRFYGTLDSYDPATSQTIEIPMSYKSFGLKLELDSIPAGTYVTVKDGTDHSTEPTSIEDPTLIITKDLKLDLSSDTSNSWDCIYSLNDFSSNTARFILEFEWHKGAGNSQKVRKGVNVEANKMKVLKLKFAGDVNETKSGNISFTNMEESLTSEEEYFKYNFDSQSTF